MLQPRSLTIISLEDEPETIRGSLDSLEFDGHIITVKQDIAGARAFLQENDADLFLVDEHVAGVDDGGSSLVVELKAGSLGSRNVDIPFGFVTGSRAWVDVREVARLRGYLGVEVKGGDLTRTLKRWVEEVIPERVGSAARRPLRRVPMFVERIDDEGRDTARIVLSVPAWSTSRTLRLPWARVPSELREHPDSLTGRWFIVHMSLDEPDPDRVVIERWEPQEPLSNDDGLA